MEKITLKGSGTASPWLVFNLDLSLQDKVFSCIHAKRE